MKRKQRSQPRRRNSARASDTQAIVRIAPAQEKPWELDNEQITIIKNSIAKGASDDELKYCLTVARRYKLDPFKRQIWFVKRWDSNADNGYGATGAHVWTPQVGIDGLLFMSARDHHQDFGSISLPEYGPMYKPQGATFQAPEWAKVKVFKKGVAEPTEAIAYFDEYCPQDFSKAPFWRKMPRRMIGKCASALALRQAYPDLGGLYIPEECDRIAEGYTPGGREIIEQATQGAPLGTRAAAQAVLDAKLSGRMPMHPEIAAPATSMAQEPAKAEIPKSTPPPKVPEHQAKYHVEIDWTDPQSPILRGQIADLLPLFQKFMTMTRKDDWWHITPKDAQSLLREAGQYEIAVTEIQPKQSPPGGQRPSASSPARKADKGSELPPAPSSVETVACTIERVQPSSDGKRAVVTVIKNAGGKVGWTCFDKDIYGILLANLGKLAELIIQTRASKGNTYVNLVGLRRVGATEYENGKTPVIQNKTREAGMKTLF